MKPYSWYVSYLPEAMPNCTGRRPMRVTRKFNSETEAKRFAQEIVKTDFSAMAGTLNPSMPRKVIASRAILDWISQKD